MSVTVNGVLFTGDPCRVVSTVFNGRYVRAGERTMAHLFYMDAVLRKKHGCWIYVLQSAYNSGVSASAGTHDYDGCLDVLVINIKTGLRLWAKGQRLLRKYGAFDWWRHTGTWFTPSSWHHHYICGGVVECGCPVGVFVPGQNADYRATPPRNGLVGHPVDKTWHPADIAATVFNFKKWMQQQEEEMTSPKDWDAADWAAFRSNMTGPIADAVWDAPVNRAAEKDNLFSGKIFRSLLKDIWKGTRA